MNQYIQVDKLNQVIMNDQLIQNLLVDNPQKGRNHSKTLSPARQPDETQVASHSRNYEHAFDTLKKMKSQYFETAANGDLQGAFKLKNGQRKLQRYEKLRQY